jgi:hypothetical protein
MRALCVVFIAVLLAGAGPRVSADVVEVSDTAFFVRNKVAMAASPQQVYDALTGEIAEWWDGAHSISGDAANLSLDPRPGGCFCERLPAGGGVRHLTVLFASPGKELRLSGGLGPLQEGAVVGMMIWRLARSGGATEVELSYRVSGSWPGGLGTMAEPVDGVLREQLLRLKSFVEAGV